MDLYWKMRESKDDSYYGCVFHRLFEKYFLIFNQGLLSRNFSGRLLFNWHRPTMQIP